MSPEKPVVIVIYGEGKTEVRLGAVPTPPTKGVLPILTHKLCGKPARMRVLARRPDHLQLRSLWRKVWFAKLQANVSGSHGVVFVVDSEGDMKEKKAELEQGRQHGPAAFPTAIGVAHPCIEAWLLADGTAIRRALDLATTPMVPEEPENLPAPCADRKNNPKTALRAAACCANAELSADEKDKIAAAINDFDRLRTRCPLGFAPFEKEVVENIRPLFDGG